MALEVLEPCAVKVASTVLRGSGDGDISALLDVRHEVACSIVMPCKGDMTGCSITCTLGGMAAR